MLFDFRSKTRNVGKFHEKVTGDYYVPTRYFDSAFVIKTHIVRICIQWTYTFKTINNCTDASTGHIIAWRLRQDVWSQGQSNSVRQTWRRNSGVFRSPDNDRRSGSLLLLFIFNFLCYAFSFYKHQTTDRSSKYQIWQRLNPFL